MNSEIRVDNFKDRFPKMIINPDEFFEGQGELVTYYYDRTTGTLSKDIGCQPTSSASEE